MAETTPVATAANWLDAPYNRWGFRHVPDLLPTAVIGRGGGPVRELPRDERGLDAFAFTPRGPPLTRWTRCWRRRTRTASSCSPTARS